MNYPKFKKLADAELMIFTTRKVEEVVAKQTWPMRNSNTGKVL